jgi:hypothetical protein
MSVLITTAVLLLVVLWALGSWTRLVRLRRAATNRWREVNVRRKQREDIARNTNTQPDAADLGEADSALEQARLHYNLAAAKYNEAITGLPGSIVAGLAGFKRADFLAPEHAAGTPPPTT